MSMDSQDMNLEFKRSSSQAYGGFKKTAVLPEDAELTHTDPGTPMGNLMRRFWQPVCLSEELTDVPRAIRILGEDLVAFRDKSGQVGVSASPMQPSRRVAGVWNHPGHGDSLLLPRLSIQRGWHVDGCSGRARRWRAHVQDRRTGRLSGV